MSQTRQALVDFDNQHDFERMAADVLNALGYADVEPMAPSGGPDGGRDIQFREGDTQGVAFVTLEKKIKAKFESDLSKRDNAEGVIALFCNVDVTPSMKLTFSKGAIAKGYRLMVFDLERLRSLIDSSLKEIRRRYLHIDDEVAAKLRSEVHKLLNYPDAILDNSSPPTKFEQMLVDKLPCRLFDLLMGYEEDDIVEVPGIGSELDIHLKSYHQFRQEVLQFENDLNTRIATIVGDRFNSAAVWNMYFKYVLPRFFGIAKEEVIAWGNFLNLGVTWDACENVFSTLSNEPELRSQVDQLESSNAAIIQRLSIIRAAASSS
ncbi:hypothetical protein ACFLW1_02580 [Chloroflexota bacterium]